MRYKIEKDLNILGDIKEIKGTDRLFLVAKVNEYSPLMLWTTEKVWGTAWYMEFKEDLCDLSEETDLDKVINSALIITNGIRAEIIVENELPDKHLDVDEIMKCIKYELPESIEEINVKIRNA